MYHFKGALTIGQVNRFEIKVEHDRLPADLECDSLAIRVKNTTSALMRPALMTGPYILYTSVREQSYRHDTALGKGDFPPHFDANVKTHGSRWQNIPITPPPDAALKSRIFVVEVASQIIFSPAATVHFEITIGKTKSDVRHLARQGDVLEASTPGFDVKMQDTSTIWDMPPVQRDHPGHHILPSVKAAEPPSIKLDASGRAQDHLVVLTHGIHSNLTSDMLYMKEIIEMTAQKNGERVICKGFAGNACNTERGVKWLAENVGEWVLHETGWKLEGDKIFRGPNPYKSISFIAHSLGGLVQMYVVGYLHDKTQGRIFRPEQGGLEPTHYITLATPWLGISAENPAYVKLALDFGLIGKTGQDLGLTVKPLGEYHVYDPRTSRDPDHIIGTKATVRSREPLLKLLSHPTSPSHRAMRLFQTRTIYANIENDGIVPLRTSSLFFLDWEQFSAEKAKVLRKLSAKDSARTDSDPSIGDASQDSVQDDMKSMGASSNEPSTQSKTVQQRDSIRNDAQAESASSNEDSSSEELDPLPERKSPRTPQIIYSSDPRNHSEPRSEPISAKEKKSEQDQAKTIVDPNRPENSAQHIKNASSHGSSGSISRLLGVAHAVHFAGMIRRVSGGRLTSKSGLKDEPKIDTSTAGDYTETETDTEPQTPQTPQTPKTPSSPANKLPASVSGPSDVIELASHNPHGLLGLLKPNQQSRKPSKAFTRSQTIPRSDTQEADEEDNAKVHPEEPSKTSFFRSLESVLNPPMPGLDYITDPAHREPPETVIVHDKFYYPRDIPPLKELPARSSDKDQSHSEKKAEDKEHVRLEKIRLEETIAREWHKDMSFRKVLVKLRPDAHNNIIVRRMYPNCFGWPVIDHLAEHHFGASLKKNKDMHDCQDNQNTSPTSPKQESTAQRADSQ